MYNPASFYECLKHSPKERRKWVDRSMTGLGMLNAFSSLPQVIQNFESHHAEGVSLMTYTISTISIVAWIGYGFYIGNKPLIYTSSFATLFNILVILQIL